MCMKKYRNKNVTFSCLGMMAVVLCLLMACGQQHIASMKPAEDATAKKMLQGIWLSEGEEDVVFRAQGDTIYYPDSTSVPVYFQIIEDSLILHGSRETAYRILKQTPHLFVFETQTGDSMRVVKSEDATDAQFFFHRKQAVVINQGRVIRRDTVVVTGKRHYHCYMQVNPTTYKVQNTACNPDGVAVDNVYFDNIVHLTVYDGGQRLFSRNFAKADFTKYVPQEILSRSLLSDIVFVKADEASVTFSAALAIPNSSSSYQVAIIISADGKFILQRPQ